MTEYREGTQRTGADEQDRRVLARQAGLTTMEAMLMSATVLAGAAQLIAVELWSSVLHGRRKLGADDEGTLRGEQSRGVLIG